MASNACRALAEVATVAFDKLFHVATRDVRIRPPEENYSWKDARLKHR